MIYDAGIAISKKQASRLLLTAAKSPKTVGLVIDFLKQRGADLDTVDKKKMTPLMHAVKNNKVEFAERLLKAGANPNYMADSAVGTALQLAESKGYVNLEKILRDHGAKD
jgi:ankyrin repeat protein